MSPSDKPVAQLQRRLARLRLYPSINTRIIGPFLIVVLIVASIGMFLVTRLVAGSLQERLTNQLVDSANAASSSLVDIESQQLATLRLLTLTEGVPNAIATSNKADLERWLQPIAVNGRVDSVIVFDQAGNGLLHIRRAADSDPSHSGQYQSIDAPFLNNWSGVQKVLQAQADALGDKFVDIIGQAADSPYSMLYISAPVRDPDGHVVGGVSVGMQGDHLAQHASDQALSGVVLLTDNGEIIGSAFKAPPDKLKLISADSAQLVQTVDSNSPIRSIDIDGVPYQVLYSRLRERSQSVGLLAVALPSNLILDRSGLGRNVFGVLFSILFVAVALLGVVAAGTITRPVSRLVGVTRAVRSGDLSRRAALHMPDELGELGDSLDEMTGTLVQRNDAIHTLYVQQVRETIQRDAILGSISDAVIVQDISGRLILRNASADQLVSAVAQSASSRAAFDFLCARPERLLPASVMPQADVQPLTVNFAGRFFSVVSSAIHVPADAESVDRQDGQKPNNGLLGYVLVFRDVTPLLEAERLKEQLLSQMSHELRTPLTAARGYVDLVKMISAAALTDQAKTFLGNATDSLDTLERMVNTVIDVSTIVSGQFVLERAPFELQKLLEARVRDWQPAIHAREQTLTLHVSLKSIMINADRERLGSVVDHLLRNANSYTLSGGVLELAARVENDDAIITVRDTGVGIGADEIDRVFEQLYRGRAADAGLTDTRGLGLGLYLSKRIIEAHHGQISVSSERNRGTTVTIRLPLAMPIEPVQEQPGLPPPNLYVDVPRA